MDQATTDEHRCVDCGEPLQRKGGRRVLRAQPCRECGRPVARGLRRLGTQICTACLRVLMADRAVAYRAANPKACRATVRRYRQRNPDVHRSHNARRRARRRAVLVERFRHEEIFERDGWRCQICMRKVRRNARRFHPLSPSLDHVIPLVEGGPHTRANTRCAHLRCNTARGARGGGEQLALI